MQAFFSNLSEKDKKDVKSLHEKLLLQVKEKEKAKADLADMKKDIETREELIVDLKHELEDTVKEVQERDQTIDAQKTYIDRISLKTKSLGEESILKDQTINNLRQEIEELKIKAKVTSVTNSNPKTAAKWIEGIKDMNYLKTALRSAISSTGELRENITKLEEKLKGYELKTAAPSKFLYKSHIDRKILPIQLDRKRKLESIENDGPVVESSYKSKRANMQSQASQPPI